MKTILELGHEFFYDTIISFLTYSDFKTLQCLNNRFYKQLDHSFYNRCDGNRVRNGLFIKHDGGRVVCYNGDIKHGPFKAFHKNGNIAGNGLYINGKPAGGSPLL